MYRSLYRRPINLNAKAQTSSNHKSRNIIKYLVGLTLLGAVSSDLTDDIITVISGIDNLSPSVVNQ